MEKYYGNYILNIIYEQVDDNGWDTGILQEITGIRSDPKVDILQVEDAMVDVNAIKKMVITMKGWDYQVLCKDKFIYWLTLKFFK